MFNSASQDGYLDSHLYFFDEFFSLSMIYAKKNIKINFCKIDLSIFFIKVPYRLPFTVNLELKNTIKKLESQPIYLVFYLKELSSCHTFKY